MRRCLKCGQDSPEGFRFCEIAAALGDATTQPSTTVTFGGLGQGNS